MQCPQCRHEIGPKPPRCLYCGFSDDPRQQAVTDAGRVQAGTYRSGGTVWPFIFSAALLGALGMLFIFLALKGNLESRRSQIMALVGTALLVMGPAPASVQIARRRLCWVRIVPDQGLDLSGRALIPWSSIRSVESYRGAFGSGVSFESFVENYMGRGTKSGGCMAIPMILLIFVFLPLLSVLSPWYPRVTLGLTHGERIVLRDLEDSETFVQMVRYKIRG